MPHDVRGYVPENISRTIFFMNEGRKQRKEKLEEKERKERIKSKMKEPNRKGSNKPTENNNMFYINLKWKGMQQRE